MPIRIIQVFARKDHEKRIREILEENGSVDCYFEKLDKGKILARAFLPSEKTEQVMDLLETYFSKEEKFRIAILPLEASVPRHESPPEDKENGNDKGRNIDRVSREELYASVSRNAGLSKIYLFLIAAASLVAALGLIYGNVVAIIGAMVIAPLLGPNIALALATTLADSELAKKAIKALAAGIFFALVVSALIGFFLNIDLSNPEIASRTQVGFADIAVALVSGSVGVIAFTSGYFLVSLMGVMVAVAILPPLVVSGMFLGSGVWTGALSALLLLGINLVCINLAGIATFVFFKVRPRTWWEADKAKQNSRRSFLLWVILLLTFVFLMLLTG